MGVNRTMCPMFIHSYHNGHKRDAHDMDELGYSFNRLAMSPTDLDEMQRAYLGDESVHLAVPMKKIYRSRRLCLHQPRGSKEGEGMERYRVLCIHSARDYCTAAVHSCIHAAADVAK